MNFNIYLDKDLSQELLHVCETTHKKRNQLPNICHPRASNALFFFEKQSIDSSGVSLRRKDPRGNKC